MLRRHFIISGILNGEICYKSSDGNIVKPNNVEALPTIIFNTYINGRGVIKFKTDVISIGNRAFKNCSSLTSITIPNSVTSIGDEAFAYCYSLTSVTIPDSVTSIGNRAFYDCSSLTSIIIPNNVRTIGYYAFNYCTSLTSVTIPNSVISIGYDAFERTGIYDNEDNWENDVLYINDCLIAAKESISGACEIKAGTRIIADGAFRDCESLTSVTIPNSVTSIGEQAFSWCNSLTSVTIGNSVTNIKNNTFCRCESLTSVTIPNSVTSIGNRAFAFCYFLTSITFEGTIEEWNTITKDSDWYYDAPITVVHCTDGDIQL